MRRVALTRIAAALPLLLGLSLISFLLVRLAPGSFLDRLRLDPAIPRETIEAVSRTYGLDRPWYAQYVSWVAGAAVGDLGVSLAFQRPVAGLLRESAGYTAALVVSAGAVALVGGLALALAAAVRSEGAVDRMLSAMALALVSLPTLLVAIVALGWVAAVGGLPIGGGPAPGVAGEPLGLRVVEFARHLVLPAAVLSVAAMPSFFLQSRAALLDVLPSDFARAAYARGLGPAEVLLRHCLRAALVPVAAFAGSSVGRLLNGAFLVEVVTGWPGMGRIAWTALLARDSFLMLGVLLMAAVLMLAGNLAADLAAAAADPRVRLEER